MHCPTKFEKFDCAVSRNSDQVGHTWRITINCWASIEPPLMQVIATSPSKISCLVIHPDRTGQGDDTQFKKINEAYNVLTDEDRRPIYDRYGHPGLQEYRAEPDEACPDATPTVEVSHALQFNHPLPRRSTLSDGDPHRGGRRPCSCPTPSAKYLNKRPSWSISLLHPIWTPHCHPRQRESTSNGRHGQ